MSGMARGKRDMLDAFLSQEAGKGMCFILSSRHGLKMNTEMLDLLQGRTIATPDETEAMEKKPAEPQRHQPKRPKKSPFHSDEADSNISEETVPIRLDKLDKSISKEMAPILDRLEKSTPNVSAPIRSDESDKKTLPFRRSISAGSMVDGGDPLTDPIFTDDVGDDRSMKSCSLFCRDDILMNSGISGFTEKSSGTCQLIQRERRLMRAFHLQFLNHLPLCQVSFLPLVVVYV